MKSRQLGELKVSLRRANQKDVSLMQEFIFAHGKNDWNFLPEKEVKAHLAKIETGEVLAFLAENQQGCVGFVCYYLGLPPSCESFEVQAKGSSAYLSEIVVHRDHVGQGIGSLLISFLKEYVKCQGINRLYAERHADNPGSSGVLRKTGFQEVAEYHDPDRRLHGSQKTVVLVLTL